MVAAPPRRQPSSGIALAAVLFVLVLLGLLASAAFFIALKEMQSGQTALFVQRALASAEGTADSIVSHWNWPVFGGLAIGDSATIRPSSRQSAGVQATVTRTGNGFFVVKSTGFFGPARQQVALVVRVERGACTENAVSCDLTTICCGSERIVRVGERGWIGAF